ncbi:ester cyclase [Sulfitobacter aestuariivivens]|uniref:Ester cyclase n=1 Tax=Sulfitobacter aestuariivivens TaxID=2766981 RepID=A0A927D127_9RHOB|nr:ester cyclase [Sulfitobacter aestuariivivens]MBD3662413.1 ester cyclase [Sulfitobacter aestuariivivens]
MSITETAHAFFDACETGQGWEVCAQYCHADASFAAQSEAIAEITTLEGYCDWMKGLLTILEDGSYELKSFGTDTERACVVAYAVFTGSHSGDGGPVPPTGKTTSSDYVYHMAFRDGKVAHMTKIWNAPWALRELGWG